MPKPNEFFLSVRDFFAVLLPGAVAAFCLGPFASARMFNGRLFPVMDGEVVRWSVFAVSAYILGHVIAALGSKLDLVYDGSYKPAKAHEGKVRLEELACELRDRDLRALGMEHEPVHWSLQPLGAYQWARAVLMASGSGIVSELERLEADSKFFRGMTVVALVYAAAALISVQPWGVLLGVGGAGLSFWGFCRLRLKATDAAYRGLIAARACAGHAAGNEPAA